MAPLLMGIAILVLRNNQTSKSKFFVDVYYYRPLLERIVAFLAF